MLRRTSGGGGLILHSFQDKSGGVSPSLDNHAYGILEPMKGETKSAGFTIVETLLVLAVTGFLFLMVMITLSGKQNRAQFQQAVRDIQTKTEQTINEVSTGFYPNNGDFSCSKGSDPYSPGSAPRIVIPAVRGQGTNEDCVFLGKMMQFDVGNTDPETFNTYSVAGLRSGTTLATSRAVVIDSPTVIQQDTLRYGLKTKSMCSRMAAACTPVNTVGFISQIGDLSSNSTYESGSVDLVSYSGFGLGANANAVKTSVNTTHLNDAKTVINPQGGVEICFQSGTNSDTALMVIGSNGHNLNVQLTVKAC
jgi:type II secretory pathway pseudopilin PulG